tara:strand:- start:984 stop:1124 length:141 start_codon:yes stop_codon:yes gene_type:complete
MIEQIIFSKISPFYKCLFMVGAAGFEPTTSRPPAGRATKLRHAPQN